jgi:hypothetical protein
MSSVKAISRLAATLVVAASALSIAGASTAHAAGSLPWTDTSVTGFIGLCDSQGHSISSGSLDSAPFVTRAVSSVAAPSPYGEAGRTATLYAFQPRQDLAPGQWSGDMLTASTRYSNSAHPTAVATGGDLSLGDFVSEFPPAWDGLVQLRLYLGAPGQPAQTLSYASTTVKVTGSTWTVVSGGNVSCASGQATSIESILLPKKALKVHHTADHSNAPAISSTPASTPDASSGPATQPSGVASDPLTTRSASSSGGSTNVPELILIVVMAVALAASGVGWLRRRSQERSS